jgi:shikimate dehydrogenase
MEKIKACVIGSPILHSLSPVIHNAAYNELNINWNYDRQEVTVSNFTQRIAELLEVGYIAFNVTMPCKEAAHNFCDYTFGSAHRLNSVNTIIVKEGKTYGHSTDGDGFVNFLNDENIDFAKKSIVIIGSGGAARSISDALYEHGSQLTLCARNVDSAKSICEGIRSSVREKTHGSSSINYCELSEANDTISQSNIIINATPIGMQGTSYQSTNKTGPIESESFLFDLALLNKDQIVIDTIYSPLETSLLNRAKSLGCPAYNGINMLLYQAALSFELMTGEKAPINVMQAALMQEIKNR